MNADNVLNSMTDAKVQRCIVPTTLKGLFFWFFFGNRSLNCCDYIPILCEASIIHSNVYILAYECQLLGQRVQH